MANLKQTSITGSSGTTSLLVSGSSIIMPSMSGSVDSGSAAQMYIDVSPTAGLTMKLTQAGSFGSQNSPYSCLSTWNAGANLITPRCTSGAGLSIDSLIAVGGYDGSSYTGAVEEYNGTSWSTGNSLTITRWTSANGTQNAAMAAGGATPSRLNRSEQYNGTSWSDSGNMNVGRSEGAFMGECGNAFYVGGSAPLLVACSEVFIDNIGWSVAQAAPTVMFGSQGVGTHTAAQIIVGSTSLNAPTYNATTCTINFNGVSFSASTPLTTCHSLGAGYGESSDSMGIVAGCSQGNTGGNSVEEWDGNSWSVHPTLPVVTKELGGGGSALTGAGVFGGINNSASTFIYDKTLTAPFTYNENPTTDSWSRGASLIQGARKPGGFGTQNSAVAVSGTTIASPTESLTCTQEYNGSSWTAGGAIIQGRCALGASGTQNAGLAFGGANTPTVYANTEEYNGTAWANGGALIAARSYSIGGGTQNAGLAMGGFGSGTAIEEYNGTSWATAGNLSSSRYAAANNAGPSQTDGVIVGGYPIANQGTIFQVWNGTSTATGPNTIKCLANGGAGVTDSNNIVISGGDPAGPSSQFYNGTSWAFGANTPQNMESNASAGSGTAWGLFGGICGSPSTGDNIFLLYNTATNVCSTTPFCSTSWSAGSNMIVARANMASAGTQNAALAIGGSTSSPQTTCTEEYNGSTWASGGALIKARDVVAGSGTQNAGLVFGGLGPAVLTCTEEYDGSNWAAGGALIIARRSLGGAGTQNASIAFGGFENTNSIATEEYNGSSWTAGNYMNTARRNLTGDGTQNATIGFGGYGNSNSNSTEQYNGTTWSSASNMITGRYSLGAAGTQIDAIAFGGASNPALRNQTEKFNGIAWSEDKTLSTARGGLGGAGTTNAALAFGGYNPSLQALTEEFTCANFQVGAWSITSPLITARRAIGPSSLGSQNAALAGGGITPSALSNTEEYNGSSWAAGGALIVARSALNATGTQNANLSVGGSPALTCVEEYNGSTWTAKTSMINGVYYMGITGTTDAALKFSGYSSSYLTCSEEWNGASWSTGNSVGAGRTGLSGANGTQNAAIWALGFGGSYKSCHEHYDGTSWSAKSAVITTGEPGLAAIGTQNAYITSGLYGPAFSNITNEWNGISWNNGVRHPISGNQAGSSGTADSLITYGAQTPTALANAYNYDVTNPVNRGIYCFTKTL